jgi:cyclic pyranopterin phosphate synthase
VHCGVKKIRITGGEPLVRRGIENLMAGIGRLKQEGLSAIAITTNGVLLKEKLAALKSAGLDNINLSLDTLKRERFQEITYRDHFDDVIASIFAALEYGFTPLKVNTVILRGFNEDEILDFIAFIQDKPINVRFIEFMPFDGNQWDDSKLVPYQEMKCIIESKYRLHPIEDGQNYALGPAKDFAVEGCVGTVGFITSMTDSFCSGCNRIRITADGYFRTCLFSEKNEEYNLKSILRGGASDDEIAQFMISAVWKKEKAHPEIEELIQRSNRSMIQLGG